MASAVAVAVVALVGTALTFAPGSTGRWVTGIVGMVVGLALVLTDVVRTARARSQHPELAPVTKHLSPRERSAVQRLIRGRVQAPEDRVDVVRRAIATAGTLRGSAPARAEVLVVGGTPNDITSAHDAGATAVGVASGHYSADELRDAGADLVLESLEDPALERLLGL